MTYPVTIGRSEAARPALPFATRYDATTLLGDWIVAGASSAGPDGLNARGLSDLDQLESNVFVSLFTHRQAPVGWRPEVTDRRGWWGDGVAAEGRTAEPIGSHLWLLRNEIATARVAALAKVYAEEALSWLLRDGVVGRIAVASELIENPRRGINLTIEIFARDGTVTFKAQFARLWQEIGG
jgi:phage gp46-like protein